VEVKRLIRAVPGLSVSIKVFKDLVSRGYLYRSRILSNFEWETLEDCINDYIKWVKGLS
jgi:hypothetical protein